ncbi:hypothetical protein [Polyangium mundeleinium]|uniref:Uncharacterized protein n=1 Tax=Polyangium mundeleinium TaxID=2995306 RepID=A0ABT5EDX0_9BACT|nr:hypothetical protein [Polyangium mundeleinium]MDC0740011.1 hypothetical protein [Polyangium mundeleinium]
MRVVSSRFALAVTLAGLVFTQGCREAASPPPVAEEPKVAVAPKQAEEPKAADAPKQAEEGVETREGELHPSKGFGSVADVLIPRDDLKKHLGADWQKTTVGKRVRVRGKLRIHKCGPQEQCLIQGELPILTPDSIEVLP